VACAAGKRPSVNKTLMMEPNCEKNILKFEWISNDKKHSKFNIFRVIDLKIPKSPSLNFTH
jgi:hypothetical protein